jgi:hypothetical protein
MGWETNFGISKIRKKLSTKANRFVYQDMMLEKTSSWQTRFVFCEPLHLPQDENLKSTDETIVRRKSWRNSGYQVL